MKFAPRLPALSAAILSLATAAVLIVPAAAQNSTAMKIGIVDMQQGLQNYYKPKQAHVDLNQRRDDIKRDLEERRDKLRDLVRELEDLQKQIRDEATTQEFRKLKTTEYQAKAGETQALQRDLEQLAKTKERQLMLELERTFRGIRDEVRTVVDEQAKRDGYDLVFDKSATGLGGANFLLFSKDAVDFTPSIITAINKDAPPELKDAPPVGTPPATPPAAEEKAAGTGAGE